MATTRIHKRKDVDRNEGLKKYGKVEYADDVNCKYPINNPWRIKAAWQYIHYPNNTKNYSTKELEIIRKRIKSAAENYGLELEQPH